ncbi:MAG: SPOR domain-containing protein [Bacteroidota bacterium]
MIKKISLILFLLSVIVSGKIHAQADSIASTSKDIFSRIERNSEGKIQFSQSDSLKNLVLKHIAKNRNQDGIQGYRIRIFSDVGRNARSNSEEVKTEFYEEYSDIPVYRKYDSPYFKVYVGDYRTKMEALKCLKKIKDNYPSAFVVPDQINYPEIE